VDALSAILGRTAAREFLSQPVELAQLVKIADAGRHAMSARNLQPWHFIIVRERETLHELGALCLTGRFVADAPSAIVVLKDRNNARWADNDCAQAVQNMANAAWAMGLGTCWVGNFEGDKIAAILGVVEPWAVFTVLPFGRPAPSRRESSTQRLRPRAQTVDLERFGRPVNG
jgi:nitroreductase